MRENSTLLATARTPRGAIGLTMAAVVVLTAIIGPLVAPYPSAAPETLAFGPPTGKFLLGGDYLGLHAHAVRNNAQQGLRLTRQHARSFGFQKLKQGAVANDAGLDRFL